MAQEQETILLDVKFEADEAIKRQVDLKQAQEALRREQAELNKIMKEGGDGARAAAEQYVNNEAKIKNLNNQILNNSKVIQANNQDVNNGGSAYRQLSDAYLFAAAKAKDMAAAYGVNSVEAKKATEEAAAMQAKLKDIDASVGQHTRNVGNYSSGWEGMGDKMQNVAGAASGIPGPMGKAAGAVSAFGKQLWALVANPIIATIAALVAGLSLLFKAFKSTDAGATALDGVFKALGNIVDVLIDRVASFVTLLKNFITFNWGELKKNAEDTFGGMGDSIRDAAAAGWEYAHVMDMIKDREAASLIRSAKLRQEIEELKNTTKDLTLTNEERLAASEMAMQKAKELNEIELGFIKENNEATIKNLASKVLAYGKTVDERAEMVRKWIELDDLEIESMLLKDKAFADFYNKNEEDIQKLQALRATEIQKETELTQENRRLLSENSSLRLRLRNEEVAAAKKAADERKKAAEDAYNAEKSYAEKSLQLMQLRSSLMESSKLTDEDYFNNRVGLITDLYNVEKTNIEKYTKDEEEKKVKLAKLFMDYNNEVAALAEQRANTIIRYAQLESEIIRLNQEAELVGAKQTSEQVRDLAIDNAKAKAEADRAALDAMLEANAISYKDAANEQLRIEAELNLAKAQATEAYRAEQAEAKRAADEFIAAEEYDTEMLRLQNKFTAEQTFLDMEMAAEIAAAQAKIKNAEDQEAAILAIKEKYAEYSKALKKEEIGFIASATADLFGSLAQLNAEDEKKSKAYAKIQVVISTAQAMIAAYAQGSKYSLVGGAIAAGAALAAGLVSYKNIDKKTLSGGTGLSAGTVKTNYMPTMANNSIVQGNSGFSQTQAVQSTIQEVGTQSQPVLILPHLTAAQYRQVAVANRNGL